MKITIDTKEDSSEEIKKVIHLLNLITENKNIEIAAEKKEEWTELPNVGNFMKNNETKKKEDNEKDNMPNVSQVITY